MGRMNEVTVMACYLAISAWLLSNITSHPVEESLSNEPYSGYQVLQIHFNNTSLLQELIANYRVDIWGRPSKGVADIMVGPQRMNDVLEFLNDRQASYYVKVTDVQRLLENSMDHLNPGHRQRRALQITPETVARRYLRFRQIRQFLRRIQTNATYADVTVSSLGRTFEGRVTPYAMIRQKNSSNANKQIVVIEAGMHAREWIAPAMALNIIYKLTYNPDNDAETEELLQKFDWMVVPVTNPDGYVFSQRNASTRLWRKTRTSLYAHGLPYCFGVDGNRNFGFQWTDSVDKGGSPNPCDDNYSGPQGFSEPETRNMRSLLLRLRSRIALYIALHSYGQFFLYPWGYDSYAVLEDEEDMREIAQQFAHVMLQSDRWYETGPSAQVLYAAAGASDDFARGGAGVKYAFTVELSPSDSSRYGFLLPPRQIAEVVEDHWPAFKTIALTIWDRLNQTNLYDTIHNHNPTTTNNNNLNNFGLNTAGTGRNSGDGLTDVTIDGHTFRLNLSDPAVAQWMDYYMDLLRFRSRFGWRMRS